MFCKVIFTLRAPRWDLCPSMILPGYQSECTSRQSSYILPVPKNEMLTFGIRAVRSLSELVFRQFPRHVLTKMRIVIFDYKTIPFQIVAFMTSTRFSCFSERL